MRALYKLLNVLAIFFTIVGVISWFTIKSCLADIPQFSEISSVIAIEYSAMIFISGGIFFLLGKFLPMLEEYLKDKNTRYYKIQ